MDIDDFLLKTHEKITSNIQLADQKATTFVVLDITAVAGWFGAGFVSKGNFYSIAPPFLFIVAIFFLGIVLWPRGKELAKKQKYGGTVIPSLIFKTHKDSDSYLKEVKLLFSENGNCHKSELSGAIKWASEVNEIKYEKLKVAMGFSYLALAVSAVYLFVNNLA